LNAPKQAGIFQYVTVTLVALLFHNFSYLANAKVQQKF